MPANRNDKTRAALEAGFRAILTLFAAVLGYGLKHILDLRDDSSSEGMKQLVLFQWPIFIVVLAMFSRFLIGTAVHVTYEHLAQDSRSSKIVYLLDMFFVALYALIGLGICYADSPSKLLWRLEGLHLSALFWAYTGGETIGRWQFYFVINTLVSLALMVCICVVTFAPAAAFGPTIAGFPTWNLFWSLMVAGAVIILVWDLWGQLGAIEL